MTFRSSSSKASLVLATTLLGLTLGPVHIARAQEAAIAKVQDLNKKAIEAYDNLDPDEARKLLLQALEVCAAEGLNKHAWKATTHVNLGVVLVGALKQRDAGVKQFTRALEIKPDAKVPKRLTNPEIEAAFEAARKEAGSGPKEPVATEKPAEPPKPVETAIPADPAPPDAPKPVRTADEGGKPPADVKGIFHEPIAEAKAGEALSVRAAVEAALGFDRVVLAYRPEGASDFLARDMEKNEQGWFGARIPEPAVAGNSVAYYLEARGKNGQAVANNGTAAEPHVVSLSAPGAAPAVSQSDSGEDPAVKEKAEAAGSGKLWLVIGVGGGYGYASGSPEVNSSYLDGDVKKDVKFSGMAPTNLLHLAPEVGYFLSPSMVLSVQGRLQLVTGATQVKNPDCGPSGVCDPASGAIAVLAKLTWLGEARGKLRPYFSLSAGGGDIRYLVTVDRFDDCGANMNETCVDTVPGGKFLAGPSVGFTYALSDNTFFSGNVNALLGVPRTALNFDVNLGLGFKL